MSTQTLFLDILNRQIRDSQVCFRVDDQEFLVGSGSDGDGGGSVTLRIHHPRFFSRVLAAGNLGLGEAYMDHDFEVEEGALHDFLITLLRNRIDRDLRLSPAGALRILLLRLGNALRSKATNVQRHYDIGDALFRCFLDSTLTYSCGYAESEGDDLERLQLNKLDRICQKLRLREGERLLDIGCGYGALLIHAARHYGTVGTGITISHQHCKTGNQAVADAGLADQVDIRFADFKEIEGHFDKVVSVGMMEHVPRREYDAYVRGIARVLKPQGLGLIHTLGANAAKNLHDPFIQKYIFPNSNQPRLSEITSRLEWHGLAIFDVENMIRHYGYTVLGWRKNFLEKRDRLDPSKYDEQFMRMWEYYLECGIAAAFASDTALYQVLFSKDYAAPMPLRRV